MKLDGRLCLVTGAGSGIGRALAQRLAAEGARLVLAGRTAATLGETAALLGAGARPHVVVADIGDAAGRQRLCDEVRGLGGRLDLLVHNAGIQFAGPVDRIDDAALEAMIRTNLVAPMALTRDLLPALRAAAPSRIAFVGSVFGDIAFPLFGAYSASKAGLRGYADALRRELAPQGIGVTYAAPRATRTAMTAATAGIGGSADMPLDAPEQVAGRIVDALRRDARSIYPRGPERLFVLLQRLFPSVLDRAISRRHASAAALHPSSTAGSSS